MSETLGDIFETIADQLATARTKALMGEREEALGHYRAASEEYTRFRDALAGYPGMLALQHAFEVTIAALRQESAPQEPARKTKRTARREQRIHRR